ncbi:hypothetical protein ACH5RR_003576 [Cinchona calisaya]|uniref:Uncharacterized protein n=1 Tax=Cinchona calisaya TaxID=153742 RepID=A0ABD3AVE8_9GENT
MRLCNLIDDGGFDGCSGVEICDEMIGVSVLRKARSVIVVSRHLGMALAELSGGNGYWNSGKERKGDNGGWSGREKRYEGERWTKEEKLSVGKEGQQREVEGGWEERKRKMKWPI